MGFQAFCMHLIHNEQTKLRATFLNGLALIFIRTPCRLKL
jgi:hypothetical protein